MADIKSANKKTDQNEPEANAWALLPVFVFLLIFATATVLLPYFPQLQKYFGAVPIIPAFIISLVFAMLQNRKFNFEEKLATVGKGIGNTSIVYMILIFIFAGLFAGTVGRTSAASVAYCFLDLFPMQFSLLIVFIVSCLVSLAMGTSVGSITLMAPIAISVSNLSSQGLPLCMACVICGSMFGDNLSMISDTCIAACAGIGCKPKEKFFENIKLCVPAAVITIIMIFIVSINTGNSAQIHEEYRLLDFVPYILVLILSILGLNVCLVLGAGIVSGAIIMIFINKTDFYELINNMSVGLSGMYEIIFITILVAAISALINKNGGFEYVLQIIKKICKTKKIAQLAAGLMVAFINVVTANNTVAIIVSAPISKEVSNEYQINKGRMASITDTFSCIVQGMLPYGAQMMMAIGLCNDAEQSISAFDIILACWYQFILLIVVLLFIMTGLSDKVNSNFSKENI